MIDLQGAVDNAIAEVKETNPEVVPQENIETPEQIAPSQEQPQVSSHNEQNIRELRELRKRDQERAARLEEENKQIMAYLQSLQQQQQVQPHAPSPFEDAVDEKHLKTIDTRINELNNQVQHWQMYSEDVTARLQLNSEFPDFNDIVNEQNINEFKRDHPEMKAAIENGDTLYNRGKLAYKLIKTFNKQQQTNNYNNNIVNANAAKPMPSVSVQGHNTSPLAGVHAASNEQSHLAAQQMYDIVDSY